MWFAISFFLGLSFIIRPESFLLGLVVTGPLLFWLLWFGSEIEKVNAKCYFVIVVVIASLGYLSDWAIYQSSPAWREAVEYKQLWKIFIDFNRVPWIDDSPVYQSVGWSHNDYQMFKSWYSLNDIYNKNNLQLLVKELSIPVTVVDFHQISRWFESAWTEPVVRFILGAQLLFWTVLRRRSLGILIVIGQCLAIVLVAQTGRVPLLRIWFSIAAVGLLAFATLPMSISGYWRGTLSTVVLVSITLISVWAITYHVTEVIKIQASASQYQKLIGKTSVLLQGKAVVWADALKYELLITPFHVYKPFPELFVLGIDSSSHTPVMASAMEHFHISDFGLWLCRGEDVRLFVFPQLIPMLNEFCSRHYSHNPRYELIFNKPLVWIASPGRNTETEAEEFTGTWDTQAEAGAYTYSMTLNTVNNKVSGSYSGAASGTIVGTMENASTLIFSWTEGNNTGTGIFVLSPDRNSFTGHYSNNGNSNNVTGTWTGTRNWDTNVNSIR
jgi:hypothetical protein